MSGGGGGAAVAADNFIVLLFRLHLTSMRTNGLLFNRSSFITAQLPINQSHVTPGGGESGLIRAAHAGPAAQNQSQTQDRQKTPDPDPVGVVSSPLTFGPGSSPSSSSSLLSLQACSTLAVPPSWSSPRWPSAAWESPLSLTETKTSSRTTTWTWSCVTTGCCSELAAPGCCHR